MSSSPVNVSSHLAAMAAADPDRVAVHVPHARDRTALTFHQLHDESDAIAHGLIAAGITRGTRTVLMVPPSLDFFSLTFALFKVAAVPVLIDPGMGVRNLGTCLAEAEPEAFIGIAKAHLARRLLGWGRKTLRMPINVGGWRFFCTHSLASLRDRGMRHGPFQQPVVTADEMAAILFTSGSTGVAKGAVYTHGIFAAQVEMLKATYGIEPGEIDLCTFPLFALFGPALGMTCVVPDMDASRPGRIDAKKTVETIRRFGVTNVFGSPAVIRRLGEYGERTGETLPTVRRGISAGAPASATAVERFAKMLPPGVQLFTPYGATEALPVANIGSGEILGETRHLTDQGKGVCVGRPVTAMSVYVIPISDDAIPEWDNSLCLPTLHIGEFVIRGPVVTKRYFNRDAATTLAKITDQKTGDVLHRMGDVGYIDERGRLWFCGRKSHRVETPWGTLFTDMVEPIFNTVTGVVRSALVGVNRDGKTYPVVCFEFDGPRNEDEIAREMNALAGRYEHTRHIDTFLPYFGTFPTDVRHNSKIFREKLAPWADSESGWRRLPVPVGARR
jgi:acyl-CoA synthetase (AMP-forming)/AMP-acid ligase II